MVVGVPGNKNGRFFYAVTIKYLSSCGKRKNVTFFLWVLRHRDSMLISNTTLVIGSSQMRTKKVDHGYSYRLIIRRTCNDVIFLSVTITLLRHN